MIQKVLIGFLPVLFLFLLAGTGSAQETTKRPPSPPPAKGQPAGGAEAQGQGQGCPSVGVQSQFPQPVRDGQRVSFVVNINGGDQNIQPVIVWSTSSGSITQGQSTRRIEVDTTGAGSTPERELKADIWVSGYAPECVLQASASVRIIAPATKFGEFGEIAPETFATNIKALADFLAQSSEDNVYFIAYAGRKSERGFTFNWMKKIKEALIDAGVPSRRIVASDGGFREEPLFDFWILPNGAEPPRANPTIKRTEIVYPKTTPAKKP